MTKPRLRLCVGPTCTQQTNPYPIFLRVREYACIYKLYILNYNGYVYPIKWISADIDNSPWIRIIIGEYYHYFYPYPFSRILKNTIQILFFKYPLK